MPAPAIGAIFRISFKFEMVWSKNSGCDELGGFLVTFGFRSRCRNNIFPMAIGLFYEAQGRCFPSLQTDKSSSNGLAISKNVPSELLSALHRRWFHGPDRLDPDKPAICGCLRAQEAARDLLWPCPTVSGRQGRLAAQNTLTACSAKSSARKK